MVSRARKGGAGDGYRSSRVLYAAIVSSYRVGLMVIAAFVAYLASHANVVVI